MKDLTTRWFDSIYRDLISQKKGPTYIRVLARKTYKKNINDENLTWFSTLFNKAFDFES